jgi:hypothetical protein
MTFTEYPYTRPDLDQFTATFQQQLDVFRNAGSGAEQIKAIEGINTIRSAFDTMH